MRTFDVLFAAPSGGLPHEGADSILLVIAQAIRSVLPVMSAEAEAAVFFVVGLLAYSSVAYVVWRALPILRALLRPLAFWRQPVVTAVHDGDTLSLSDGRVVRLIGVDTPEAHDCEKLHRDASATGLSPQEIMERGRHAGDIVRRLAERRRVHVKYDWRNIWSWHKGPHGRTLAYIYLLDQVGRKALMLNEEVLRRGLAVTTGHNHRYRRRFERIERKNWLGGVPRAGAYTPEDWAAGDVHRSGVRGDPLDGASVDSRASRNGARVPDVEYEVVDDGRSTQSGRPPLPGSSAAKAQTQTLEGMHNWLDRHGVPPLQDPSDENSLLGAEQMRVDRRMKWFKENRKELWRPGAHQTWR